MSETVFCLVRLTTGVSVPGIRADTLRCSFPSVDGHQLPDRLPAREGVVRRLKKLCSTSAITRSGEATKSRVIMRTQSFHLDRIGKSSHTGCH
jgi:hypothetical protein